MAKVLWTKRIKFDQGIVIIELLRFHPLASRREEALVKSALARAVEEDWGFRPQVVLLGRLGREGQWWIRQVSYDDLAE